MNRHLYQDSDGQFRWHDCPPGRQPGHTYPMVSEAAAVDPSQVAEHREMMRYHGCPTEFRSSGEPVFRSATHRRRFLKINHMYDKSSYL